MDSYDTITLHPGEVLRQVADSMNEQHKELSVTLPAHITLKSAIWAVKAAPGDVDEQLALMPCFHTKEDLELIMQELESQFADS